MPDRLEIAFFASSLVSSYWNGAATYHRGLARALHARGHRLTFYEPDAYDRQAHRDIPDPPVVFTYGGGDPVVDPYRARGAHAAFYAAQRWTINVTRADVVRAGWSPSVRLFEAAACATPVLSDPWPGRETFFAPGREIRIARTTAEVLAALDGVAEEERQAIGERTRARVLAEHTAAHRADALEDFQRRDPVVVGPAATRRGGSSASRTHRSSGPSGPSSSCATARRVLGARVAYAPGPYEALEGADAVFVVTEWSEMRELGFAYDGIGRTGGEGAAGAR